jgi:hypothetical protein
MAKSGFHRLATTGLPCITPHRIFLALQTSEFYVQSANHKLRHWFCRSEQKAIVAETEESYLCYSNIIATVTIGILHLMLSCGARRLSNSCK